MPSFSINTNAQRIIDSAAAIITASSVTRATSCDNFHFYFFKLNIFCLAVRTFWLFWSLNTFTFDAFFLTYFFIFFLFILCFSTFLLQTTSIYSTFFSLSSLMSKQSKVHIICKYVRRWEIWESIKKIIWQRLEILFN